MAPGGNDRYLSTLRSRIFKGAYGFFSVAGVAYRQNQGIPTDKSRQAVITADQHRHRLPGVEAASEHIPSDGRPPHTCNNHVGYPTGYGNPVILLQTVFQLFRQTMDIVEHLLNTFGGESIDHRVIIPFTL